MDSLMAMQSYVKRVNKEKGWYDKPISFVEACMLVTTELAEAVEAYREHDFKEHEVTTLGDNEPKYFMIPGDQLSSEIADVFIRTLDLCSRFNINLAYAFEQKMKKNETRPYRHGNKTI